MSVGHHDEAHRVFLAGGDDALAAAGAVLQAVDLGGDALDEAALGQGDHHALVRDKVFLAEFDDPLGLDLGAAGVAVFGLDFGDVGLDEG